MRKARGWTQEKLAERWGGHSRHSVVRLEGGDGDTDLDLLVSLAEVFGLSPAEFAWPVIAVEEAVGEQERARAQFRLEVTQHWRELRERYLTAFNDGPALWVLQYVNTIAANATPEQVSMLLMVLKSVAAQAQGLHPLKVSRSHLDEATTEMTRSGLPLAVQSE